MTLTTYSPVGPWTNGAPPGINKSFLDGIENFLAATGAGWDSNASWDGNGILTLLGLALNTTGTPLSGGSSGTATLYQPLRGTIKFALVVCSNFKTGGSNQTIALPAAFTTSCAFIAFDCVTFSLKNGASTITLTAITSLAIAGGSTATGTSAGNFVLGQGGGWDTLQFTSGAANAHSGPMLFFGV